MPNAPKFDVPERLTERFCSARDDVPSDRLKRHSACLLSLMLPCTHFEPRHITSETREDPCRALEPQRNTPETHPTCTFDLDSCPSFSNIAAICQRDQFCVYRLGSFLVDLSVRSILLSSVMRLSPVSLGERRVISHVPS